MKCDSCDKDYSNKKELDKHLRKTEKCRHKVNCGICKICNKEHDKNYGIGVFCSMICAKKYSSSYANTEEKRKQKSEKLKSNYSEKQKPELKCFICDGPIKYNCDKRLSQQRKTCSEQCLTKAMKNGSHKGGIMSTLLQNRRSKGEIYFAELCKEFFGDNHILCNPQMFFSKTGLAWDADVVIPVFRVCVLYNGIWHYQQICANSSLLQIQSRDKLKQNIIHKNGYVYYIIKDMGRFDKKFVKEEFDKFIEYLESSRYTEDIGDVIENKMQKLNAFFQEFHKDELKFMFNVQ